MLFLKDHNAVIFDDHLIFLESFSVLLERLNLFKEVYSFSDENKLIQFFISNKSDRPVYIFLDYYLPDRTAVQLIKDIRRVNKSIKIILLTSLTNVVLINDVLHYNPNGVLSKSSGMDEVLDCLLKIGNGEQYVSPFIEKLIEGSIPPDFSFTAREQELLQFFAKGNNVEETAKAFYLSRHTIISHRRTMMRKSNTKSIVELLAYAKKINLI